MTLSNHRDPRPSVCVSMFLFIKVLALYQDLSDSEPPVDGMSKDPELLSTRLLGCHSPSNTSLHERFKSDIDEQVTAIRPDC